MKQAGFGFGGEVAKAFTQPIPRPAFGPNALSLLQATYGPPPPITLRVVRRPVVRAQPALPLKLSSSGFRAVASGDLAVLNEVLTELWHVRTIPNQLTPGQTAKVITLADLQDACTGVPPNPVLGSLAITAPPVASPSTVTPLSLHVAVPFNLPVEAGAASLRGVAHLEQPLGFENKRKFAGDPPRIGLTLDAVNTLSVRLEISGFSLLQPRSEDKRRLLEQKVAKALRAVWLSSFVPNGTLSIPGDVSISNSYPNSKVEVSQIGVACIRAGSKDFVIAGINVEDNQPTDPSKLVTESLPDGKHNLHAVVDQKFATDTLSSIIRSGDLAAFINRIVERHVSPFRASEIVVTDGSISFEDGLLRISIDCTAKEACPLGKDLSFTATLTGTPVIDGGTLAVQTSKIDIDVDNFDAVVCTLLGAILGPLGVVFMLAVLTFLAVYDPRGKNPEFPATDNTEPLPGSDQDLKIQLTRASVVPETLVADGQVGLVPDTIRAFVCLRLVTGLSPGATTPLGGATVELLELDSPAPAGDDVEIPETGETERFTKKFIIDEARSYQPLPDQSLGTRITDKTGFVRFVSRIRSTAGIFTDITTTEVIVTGKLLSTRTRTDLIEEAKPDFAINVIAADGTVLAKRLLIALNNLGKHLGTLDQPLVVRVNPQGALT